jgi:hypothetical protein
MLVDWKRQGRRQIRWKRRRRNFKEVEKTITDVGKNIEGMYEKVRAKRRIPWAGEGGG